MRHLLGADCLGCVYLGVTSVTVQSGPHYCVGP